MLGLPTYCTHPVAKPYQNLMRSHVTDAPGPPATVAWEAVRLGLERPHLTASKVVPQVLAFGSYILKLKSFIRCRRREHRRGDEAGGCP